MTSTRPTHWPKWSRPWGPAWAGWWHIPREERRKIAADPGGYRDRLDVNLRLPGEKHGERAVAINEFRCAVCRGVFTKGWGEEEAAAEKQALWGDVAEKDCDVVCDPCFKKLTGTP